MSNSSDSKALGNVELVWLLAELTECCLWFAVKISVKVRYDRARTGEGTFSLILILGSVQLLNHVQLFVTHGL